MVSSSAEKADNDTLSVHLGMIQNVISRMASNSFLLRGWSVTLVAALSALAAADAREQFAYLALLPALAFWGLDAYYLQQERLFRKLYEGVRKSPKSSTNNQTFSMDTSPYRHQVRSIFLTPLTAVLILFHGTIVISIAAVIVTLSW